MANVNVAFTASLKYSDGTAATSAVVKATRQQDGVLAAAMATADVIEGTSHASTGVISLTLVASDTVPVTYKIELPDKQYFYLRLPANAKTVGLGTLIVSASPVKTVRNITSQLGNLTFIGQDIASATTIVPTCDYHNVTGTAAITTITGTNLMIGKIYTLVFASTPTFTDGSNLKLAGNLVATADDTISFRWDGTNCVEVGRSVN